LALLALTALALPAQAAAVRRYVAETPRSYDYTFSARLPADLRLVIGRRDGSLAFRRRRITLVRARMCESSSPSDPSGLEALRDEADSAERHLRRVRRGVYRVGAQYWSPVRGGSCLRFSPTVSERGRLARALALASRAQLGHARTHGVSDPAGLALAKRNGRAARGVERAIMDATGGVCRGGGLSCSQVTQPGSVALAIDRPDRYASLRLHFPGEPTVAALLRGGSLWLTLGERGCWLGPLPASALDPQELFPTTKLALSTHEWRVRFVSPQARPDGTTALSWRSYWSRGVALIDGTGLITEAQDVERLEPGLTVSFQRTIAYPAAIEQHSPVPLCA
jgi:hypothetical protein